MNEFFAMGGYGAYVWTSYLVASIVVAWNVWAPLQARRAALRAAARRARGTRT
ncbi:MAG: heme exporter protein CcmD [Gammaproteobacteria bacterium]|nr:heme exporter protein CcmD [Gammaproteobacteria bacterium]